MKAEFALLLSAMLVMVAAYLLSTTIVNPYSEAWLDTAEFKINHSVGEQVDFGVGVMNNLGTQNTYSIWVHVERLEPIFYQLQIGNGEEGETAVVFEIPANITFPLKVVVEIQEVDNLSLWIFEDATTA